MGPPAYWNVWNGFMNEVKLGNCLNHTLDFTWRDEPNKWWFLPENTFIGPYAKWILRTYPQRDLNNFILRFFLFIPFFEDSIYWQVASLYRSFLQSFGFLFGARSKLLPLWELSDGILMRTNPPLIWTSTLPCFLTFCFAWRKRIQLVK